MINLNICLSDIPREIIRTASNGKKYLDITVSELKDVDDKGNTHKVAIRQSKEDRESSKPIVYLGRGKEFIFENKPKTSNGTYSDGEVVDDDSLPF